MKRKRNPRKTQCISQYPASLHPSFYNGLAEQISVRTCANEDQGVIRVVPDEEPIGLNMALPEGILIAGQPMRAVARFELCAVVQDLDDLPQLIEVLAAPSGPLEVAFELPRRADGPHQRWAAFRASISGHSLRPLPASASRIASRVSAFGSSIANGSPLCRVTCL